MEKYIIYYDYEMGHEYRGYICQNKIGKGELIPFSEDDGCTEDDAFRFSTEKDAKNYIDTFLSGKFGTVIKVRG